jgi:hypothetical protein
MITRWNEALTFAHNESIASILLKLEQLGSDEIAIVAKPNLRVFRNPVSMRLLQRKAEDMGIAVSLISDNEMIRQLCAEIGFGNYSSVEAFKRDNTRRRYFEKPRSSAKRHLSTWLSAVAALLMLALIAWVGYFVLPAATVTVAPAVTSMAIDLPVVADQAVTSVNSTDHQIPAKLATAEVDGERTVIASGQRDLPGTASRGAVTFTNLTTDALTVPKSTILLAGSKAFFITQDATVSPSLVFADTVAPGTGQAFAQAVDGGDQGNVPAGAITAVQGPLAGKVTVVNRGAFAGGANTKAAYLSADDQAQAKQALLETLRQQAMDKIHGQIARNETFLASPSTNGEGAIEELTFEESPEQVTTQTKLHMKVLIRGLTFQGDDVNQVVGDGFNRAVQQQGAGAKPLDAPLAIDPPVVIGNDGSTINLQVHTSGQIATPIVARNVEQRVRGLAPDAAQSAVLGLPGVGRADVQLWPAWVKRVPSLPWRINVSIANPAT